MLLAPGSVPAARQAESAVALPAGRLSGLRLQPPVECDRFSEQASDARRAAQLSDQARRMKGAAAGQTGTLQQNHIVEAELRQVGGR